MFVITTDGMENASREFSYEKLRQLIEQKKEEIWMGVSFPRGKHRCSGHGQQFGIDADRAVNFHADSIGTSLNYHVVSETVSALRTNHIYRKTGRL
jgi:hypothetical protein